MTNQLSDTLHVTKRWFGSSVGTDCTEGKMKISLKIRPLFVDKYKGSECEGGVPQILKTETDLVKCRKRCKRRRKCIAIQFDRTATTKNCQLYSGVPMRRRGRSNANADCEIATTTCPGDVEEPAPVEPKPCVPCSNLRTQKMIENDEYCDTYTWAFTNRCNNTNEDNWWPTAPEPYCQYSCWQAGVGYHEEPCCSREEQIGKNVGLPQEDCVQCTNTRAPKMISTNRYCDSWKHVRLNRCANEGSWWLNEEEPYCQLDCWRWGVGYENFSPCCRVEDPTFGMDPNGPNAPQLN